MNKRGIAAIVAAMALVFAMALAGCAQGSSGSASSSAASGSSASAAASGSSASVASMSASASVASASAAASESASTSAASASADASNVAANKEGYVGFTMKIDASAVDKGTLYDGGGVVEEGVTVYEALVDTGLDLTVNTSSGTVYVDGIGDVIGSQVSSTSGWTYTVNGEMVSDSADQHKIADGDVIEWTFVKG